MNTVCPGPGGGTDRTSPRPSPCSRMERGKRKEMCRRSCSVSLSKRSLLRRKEDLSPSPSAACSGGKKICLPLQAQLAQGKEDLSPSPSAACSGERRSVSLSK